MSPAEIHRLIRRAKRGDQVAVAAIYEAFVEKIYQYIVYRVPTVTDAEDLTGEVFVRMVEGLPRYQITEVPFEAWLYRIAAARVADWYRRDKRRPQVELSETLSSSDPLPEDHLLREQELDTLREAVQELTDDQQQVLILRFVERRSHEETAEIMGKSISAVKSIQHRALTRLASILGSEQKARHYLRGGHDG
jgi:RNA polymerase sigma-70 factor (ECF subfamily)